MVSLLVSLFFTDVFHEEVNLMVTRHFVLSGFLCILTVQVSVIRGVQNCEENTSVNHR